MSIYFFFFFFTSTKKLCLHRWVVDMLDYEQELTKVTEQISTKLGWTMGVSPV